MTSSYTTTTSTLQKSDGQDETTKPSVKNGSAIAWAERKGPLSEKSWKSKLPQLSSSTTKHRWLDPEKSIGIECCSLGKYKCWEVVGPAREVSQPIFRATKELLDQHSEYLHESEPVPFSIMFGLYMIGRSVEKSSPTLLISCEPKKPRQKALKLIRDCGILQEYQGVKLADASRAPTTVGQVRPLGSLKAADSDFVFFAPPEVNNVCSRAMYVLDQQELGNFQSTSFSQKATIGGFLKLNNSEHDDLYCGLTVAHAFEDELELPTAASDFDFAFDGQEDDFESDSEQDLRITNEDAHSEDNITNLGSQLSNTMRLSTEERTQQTTIPTTENHGLGTSIASSLKGENPDLDWALVEIYRPHHEPANVISFDRMTKKCPLYVENIVPRITSDANVLVGTSSGTQNGVLSCSSIFFKSPYGVSFEEVWTVRIDGGLERGDSGCWVIDPLNGDLYGHIVAGCPKSGIGYLIPAYRIFSDIKRQLGGTVSLATRNYNSKLNELPPYDINYNIKETMAEIYADEAELLGMNLTDKGMIKRLNISDAAFAEMALETEDVYQALIVCPSNLKEYIRKESPYCWTDISDKAKYEAMIRLSNFSSIETRPLWARGLCNRQRDAPNLLARWFLFRRFRLASTNLQKRYGEVTPENTDYMFVAPSTQGSITAVQAGGSSTPSIMQLGTSNTKKTNHKKWQKKLVERGKMWAETSRSARPRSDVGSL